jgi:hypothetical protein
MNMHYGTSGKKDFLFVGQWVDCGNGFNQRIIEFFTEQGLYEQIFYYGENNKYVVDEEISKLQGTSPSEYYKLITTKIGKENPNGKCIPLT